MVPVALPFERSKFYFTRRHDVVAVLRYGSFEPSNGVTDVACHAVHFGVDIRKIYYLGSFPGKRDRLMTGDALLRFCVETGILRGLGKEILLVLGQKNLVRKRHFMRRFEVLRHDLVVTSPAHKSWPIVLSLDRRFCLFVSPEDGCPAGEPHYNANDYTNSYGWPHCMYSSVRQCPSLLF